MKAVALVEFEQEFNPSDLQQGSLFGAMSEAGIRYLTEHGRLLKLEPGETLYEPGDASGHFFVVCRGELEFIKYHQSHHLLTRTIRFGEEVGFVAMISLQPHGGRVNALTEALVLEITCSLYADFQGEHPQDFGILTLNLARDMARNIQRLNARLVESVVTD